MEILSDIVVGFVALQHVAFLYLEMFLWKKPAGRRIFGHSQEMAEKTAVLAANQGLYNGFLAAGLVWGLSAGDDGYYVKIFFLSCVIIAGLFGGFTAKRSIIWIQALPAAIALGLVLI